jgi:uncharacterized phage protein (TIGR01671 family)
MSREIKFRVWDKAENEFSDVSEYDSWNWFDRFRDPKIPETLTIQQYTGIKDKNGTEIYEGDIIQYQDGSYQSPKYDKVVVEWRSENDGYDYNGWKLVDTFLQGGECEIIGNIFENPKHLKA